MKTKKELIEWIIEETNQNNSVPMVINGGGFSWLNSADIENGWAEQIGNDDDYQDELEPLAPGEEFEDFRDFLNDDNYEAFTFYRIRHLNGYNEENNDIQVATYQ